MKKVLVLLTLLVSTLSQAQLTSKQVDSLYKGYPTVKSNFCPACKEWDNPYFKSIADTQKHMPLVEHELLHKDSILRKVKREGVYAAWNPVYKQPDETKVYIAANVIVKKNKDEIAKGHVMSWLWNSFSPYSAIFSDTYTFNAGFQDQFENVGTKIAIENMVDEYLLTSNVEVWGGTFGSQGTFTDGKITCTYPAYYWHIVIHNNIIQCYWLPNLKTETQAMLSKRVVTLPQLIDSLGFNPTTTLR